MWKKSINRETGPVVIIQLLSRWEETRKERGNERAWEETRENGGKGGQGRKGYMNIYVHHPCHIEILCI